MYLNCSQTCFRTLRWGHQSENSLPGHAECLANKNIFRQKFNERAKILKIVGFWLFPECKTLYSRTLNHCLLTTLTSVFSQYQKHRSLLWNVSQNANTQDPTKTPTITITSQNASPYQEHQVALLGRKKRQYYPKKYRGKVFQFHNERSFNKIEKFKADNIKNYYNIWVNIIWNISF